MRRDTRDARPAAKTALVALRRQVRAIVAEQQIGKLVSVPPRGWQSHRPVAKVYDAKVDHLRP